MRQTVLLMGLFLFVFSIPLSCGDNRRVLEIKRLKYELQERCGQRAEQVYKDKYGPSPNRSYENHYNTRLNKCFLLVTDSTGQYLLDVNENMQSMFVFLDGKCTIAWQRCGGYDEWNQFVRAMMQE